MPSYQYVCDTCNTEFTEFYRSFASAAEFIAKAPCVACNAESHRVQSVPFAALLFGNPEGYNKPAASKRFSTKLAAQSGNEWSGG